MSDDGIPLLADFGRSKFIDHRGFTVAFSGSARYLAPEILAAEADLNDTDDAYDAAANDVDPIPKLTKETDVFAFSMVALEVSNPQLLELPWRFEFFSNVPPVRLVIFDSSHLAIWSAFYDCATRANVSNEWSRFTRGSARTIIYFKKARSSIRCSKALDPIDNGVCQRLSRIPCGHS